MKRTKVSENVTFTCPTIEDAIVMVPLMDRLEEEARRHDGENCCEIRQLKILYEMGFRSSDPDGLRKLLKGDEPDMEMEEPDMEMRRSMR